MIKPDVVLSDHKIIPMSATRFGVIVTKEEARELGLDGYHIQGRVLNKGDRAVRYIEVQIGPKLRGSFEITMLEIAGRGDIVISPVPWVSGQISGTKAYLKSVNVQQDNRAIDRYDIAWRIWMWHRGFTKDADVFAVDNWMRKGDDELYPDDIRNRDILLEIADAAIEIGKNEVAK